MNPLLFKQSLELKYTDVINNRISCLFSHRKDNRIVGSIFDTYNEINSMIKKIGKIFSRLAQFTAKIRRKNMADWQVGSENR